LSHEDTKHISSILRKFTEKKVEVFELGTKSTTVVLIPTYVHLARVFKPWFLVYTIGVSFRQLLKWSKLFLLGNLHKI
jgi:hypothetical protein